MLLLLLPRRPLKESHHLVLGIWTSVLFTAAVTNIIKCPVGRLRPDFNARWDWVSCHYYIVCALISSKSKMQVNVGSLQKTLHWLPGITGLLCTGYLPRNLCDCAEVHARYPVQCTNKPLGEVRLGGRRGRLLLL